MQKKEQHKTTSPLNYPGNKSRIINQLIPLFPKKISTYYEPFTGSATVAMNVIAEKYILNDISNKAIELLRFFIETDGDKIIKLVENIINSYGFTNTFLYGKNKYPIEKNEGLSRYNKEAYNNLKLSYNTSHKIEELFVLIIFGFNHYIRFNSHGFFNIPVGKVDFNSQIREKTLATSRKLKEMNINLYNKNFLNFFKTIVINGENDFVYLDPPYLITLAPYNTDWTEENDKELYDRLDSLNSRGIKFALSNVIESNGKKNLFLINWMKKYKVYNLKRNYLNSNYRKKNITNALEVLIVNY